MSKFLGAGSCRKAYLSDDSLRCIKIAIDERRDAGVAQNKNEFTHSLLKKHDGRKYCCFPEAFAHSDDFSTIEVELCSSISEYDLNRMFAPYVTVNDVNEASDHRIDGYKGIPFGRSALRWFAFMFGDCFSRATRSIKNSIPPEIRHHWHSLEEFKKMLTGAIDAIEKDKNDSLLKTNLDYVTKSSLKFIKNVIQNKNEDKFMNMMNDLLEFYANHGEDESFMLADLWNIDQWGMTSKGDVVIIDSGFTTSLSNEHYSKNKITPLSSNIVLTEAGSSPTMFNGEEISNIKSPRGANVSTKFYTKSEYILADDGMSQHIKHLGKPDDGLWSWSDKMTFVQYDDLMGMMKVFQRNMTKATKVNFEENSLSIQVPDGSPEGWKEVHRVDNVSYMPKIGWHVCEFTFDGFDGKSGIIRNYHPGHDVTFIENNKEEMKLYEAI